MCCGALLANRFRGLCLVKLGPKEGHRSSCFQEKSWLFSLLASIAVIAASTQKMRYLFDLRSHSEPGTAVADSDEDSGPPGPGVYFLLSIHWIDERDNDDSTLFHYPEVDPGVYVHVLVCVCVCMHVHVCVWCMCVGMCVCMHVYARVHSCVHVCVRMCVCMHVCLCVRAFVRMCVCAYARACMYYACVGCSWMCV